MNYSLITAQNYVLRRMAPAGALLLSMNLVAATPAHAQEIIPTREVITPSRDIITVTGDSQVDATPDTATVRLGVQSEEHTAGEASAAESKLMGTVVDAIRKAGVEEKEIRTAELSLQPQYDYLPQTAPKLRGFQATNIVQVTTHKMAQLAPIVDAALGAGANRIEGISFSVTDDIGYRLRALQKAAQFAAQKAQALAEAIGVKLGRVASVTEGVKVQPYPMQGGPMRAMAASGDAQATPVLAGQIQINATVTLEYHIK